MPTLRLLIVRVAPLPSAPSRSDDQLICAPRSPSSASLAVALSVSATPSSTTLPSAGDITATTGGVFGGGATTRTKSTVSAMPSASVTVTLKAKLPATSGTPLSRPPPLSDSPGGSAPALTDQLTGSVPPTAISWNW